MRIIIDENEKIALKIGCNIVKKISKQEIADYLMGKYDKGMPFNNNERDRMLIMSFLPYLHTIAFEYPGYELEENQILLLFESSSLCNPSPIVLEVENAFYKFLYEKCDEN